MERGLYIAASGMLSEMQRQDLIANDLANASTPGYKADRTAQHSFAELLLANKRDGQGRSAASAPASRSPARSPTSPRSRCARPASRSTSPIAGEGFFGVQTAEGMRYTRNGRFMADGAGRLTDQLGNADRRPRRQRRHGRRRRHRRPRAARRLRRPRRQQGRRGPASRAPPAVQATGTVRSGALEGSGVDAARTMVDMIASLRAFEAGQRVITTIDSTLQKAANDVGRVVSAAGSAAIQLKVRPAPADYSGPTKYRPWLDRPLAEARAPPRRPVLEGMYTAAAGMAAQQQRLAALSNDLANVNTTGYKRVRIAFRDLVYTPAGPGTSPGVTEGAGAAAQSVGRGAAQGALKRTDRRLDVALGGPGFIRARGNDGAEVLTRDGSLQLDAERPPAARAAATSPASRSRAGTSEDDVAISRRRHASPSATAPSASSTSSSSAPPTACAPTATTPSPPPPRAARATARATSSIEQGALEASNVDVADAMADMIEAQRSFELASRAIRMQDQLLEIANGVKR